MSSKNEDPSSRTSRWDLPSWFRTNLGAGAGDLDSTTAERSPLLRDDDSEANRRPETEGPGDDAPTSFAHEARVVLVDAAPLVLTFLLQYSVDIASIVAAGRLGTTELGAVALANISAAITCFTIFQGLATGLDTLCAQAYGYGHKHLVGLYCQRMVLLLLCLGVPVAVLWANSEVVLVHLVTERATAQHASTYLRVLTGAIPGYVVFEAGKRFLQAQGLFRATTHILLVAAPVHYGLMYALVARLGFVGAPIAIVCTRTLLPALLVLYVRFVGGAQCWGGFAAWNKAFANWGVMATIAIPDMLMIEAEWLAFEAIVIMASQFGTDYLAAQSLLTTISTASFQVPFALSIAASTRIGNLIGAGCVRAAKVASRVGVVASCGCGCVMLALFVAIRTKLPLLFSDSAKVVDIAIHAMPFLGMLMVGDALALAAHGILRGIGRQRVGGPTNVVAHWFVSIPLSYVFGFVLDMKITGLYTGFAIGLLFAASIEYICLYLANWQKAAAEATYRNTLG